MRIKLPFVRRISLAFVLMIGLVSAAFSLGVFHTVHFVEEHLVSKELAEELRVVLDEDLKAGRAPRLDANTRFFVSDSDQYPMPPRFAALPEGFTEVVDQDEALYVFVLEKNDVRYALVQDQSEFETRERVLFHVTLAGFFLCIAGAWALAGGMARRVMAPVSRLAEQVRTLDLAEPHPSSLALDYADDEVGHLAAAFDAALDQLRQSLERERFFTSDVSHELRTPLMVVASSCELLRESALTDSQQEQVARIEHAAREMRDLVQTFLLLARNQSERDETTLTLEQAAQGQAELWGPRIRAKGLDFILEQAAEHVGQYNRTLLIVAMSNLLRNALHFTESGLIRLTLDAEGFCVEDSGSGISALERERIFTPSAHPAQARGERMGLGLSLVQRICERQGWRIVSLERASGGSCFRIFL